MKKKIKILAVLAYFISAGINILNAQSGINTITPDTSAALDITSSNRGLLVPRIALLNLTDKATINGGNPANGLMVFNTNAALTGGVGFYFWDGAAWKKLITGSDATGDNLGNHTATKSLDMVNNTIVNVNAASFKDQAAENANLYSLYKNNGTLALWSTKSNGDDFSINENTRTATVNNLVINKGSDTALQILDGKEATGKVLTSDENGKASWQHLNIGYRLVSLDMSSLPAKLNVTQINGSGGKGPYQNTSTNVTVVVPEGTTNVKVVIRWDIWGDVEKVSDNNSGSLRFSVKQSGTVTKEYPSISMASWATFTNSAGPCRFNSPVSYVIDNIEPGTYTFSLGISREEEQIRPANVLLYGAYGKAEVYTK